MITAGQCFVFHFSEENSKGYFYTGIEEKEQGEPIYVMCEMAPPHKLNPITSFWRMSERYFNENLNKGTIELI